MATPTGSSTTSAVVPDDEVDRALDERLPGSHRLYQTCTGCRADSQISSSVAATRSTCASVMSGQIGSEIDRSKIASATGKSPAR